MKKKEDASSQLELPSAESPSDRELEPEDRKRYSELNGNEKFHLSMRWFYAMEAFKDGTPSYLAKLLRSGWPIPPDFYEDLAKIVEAAPKPKGKGRQELDYIQRQHVWSELEEISDLRKAILLPGMLDVTASMNRQDPQDVLTYFRDIRKRKVDELAALYGVSTHTIEKAFKDYPKRMEKPR